MLFFDIISSVISSYPLLSKGGGQHELFNKRILELFY